MERNESLSLSCECKEDAIAYTVLFSILLTLKIIKVSEKIIVRNYVGSSFHLSAGCMQYILKTVV